MYVYQYFPRKLTYFLLINFILLMLVNLSSCQDIIFGDDETPSLSSAQKLSSTPNPDEITERRPRPQNGFGIQIPNLGDVLRNPVGTLQNVVQNFNQGFGQAINNQFNRRPNIPQSPSPAPDHDHHDHDNIDDANEDEPVPNCRTFRGGPGFCYPLTECGPLQRLIRNRPFQFANNLVRASICGYRPVLLACCPEPRFQGSGEGPRPTPPPSPPNPPQPIPDIHEPSPFPPPTTTTPFPIQLIPSTEKDPFAGEGPFTLVPPPPTPAPTPVPVPPSPTPLNPIEDLDIRTGCGFSNASHSRIVGGREADKGAYPWLAALGYREQSSTVNYLCGGALVSDKHVITAGHCVHNRDDLKVVRLGDHDLFSDGDGMNPATIEIDEVIKHPDYNPTTFQNDIAILRLKEAVPFTLRIHPICLPATPDLRSSLFEDKTPFVAGWGAIQFNGPSSSTLQEVQIPVVANSVCENAYKPFKNTKVDGTNICAGLALGGKDSCQGDSGGPLMQPVAHNKFVLIGVVSFGFKCAEKGFPGVYSRVTSHLDWIEDNIH